MTAIGANVGLMGHRPPATTEMENALAALRPPEARGLARQVGLHGVLKRVLGVERAAPRAGRFVMEACVGGGALGEVFRARDPDTGETVAVRICHAAALGDTATFVARAERLRALTHPHIVRVLEHGETADGRPFLVMAWLDGCTLATRLASDALRIGEALTMATRMAEGLSAIHAAGLTHGGLRPTNVFLVGRDPREPRIMDTGLPRADIAPRSRERSSTNP